MKKTAFSFLILCFGVCSLLIAQEDPLLNLALAQRDSGVQLLLERQDQKAIPFLEKARDNFFALEDSVEAGKCINNIGVAWFRLGEYSKGRRATDSAIIIYQKTGKPKLEFGSTYNLGIYEMKLGLVEKALGHYQIAMEGFREIGDTMNWANSLSSIGNVFKELGEFPKGIEAHKKAIFLHQAVQNERGEAKARNNLGMTFQEMGNLDSAEVQFFKSLELKQKLGEEKLVASTLANIGELYLKKGNLVQARKWLGRSQEIRIELGDRSGIMVNKILLGKIALEEGRIEEADSLLIVSLTMSRELENMEGEMSALELLVESEKLKGNYQNAFLLLEDLEKARRRWLDIEKQKEISAFEIRYQVESYEESLFLAEEKAHSQQIIIASQNQTLVLSYILGGMFLVIAILVAVLAIRANRQKKQKQMLLEELQHRIKNNFQSLLGLFSLQMRVAEHNQTRQIILKNRARIEAMLLIHTHLTEPNEKRLAVVSLSDYMKDLLLQIDESWGGKERGIKIKTHAGKLEIDLKTATPIGLVVNELVSNSLKYAFEGIEKEEFWILVSFEIIPGNYLKIVVRDNGVGIGKSRSPKGLGLKLIEGLVKQMRGEWKFWDEEGTIHEILIPLY